MSGATLHLTVESASLALLQTRTHLLKVRERVYERE